MALTQVAVAGATGNLGPPLLEALLRAGFQITVLSRIGGNSSRLQPNPNIAIKEVDFDSVSSLEPVLKGIAIVISCVTRAAIGSQNPLIDASVAAGVQRFIPAEFGMDSCNQLCIQLPVCAPKAETQKYLLEKSKSNPGFTWTGIANGMFLDWFIKEGLILNRAQPAELLYNGGDTPMSATTLADVAKAVLGVIKHPEETKNRLVYVQSALVTQNQLLRYAKEKDGKDWNTIVKPTEEVRKESFAILDTDVDAAMLGFCYVGIFDSKYGCNYTGHLDNELLGITDLNEAQLKELVGGFF